MRNHKIIRSVTAVLLIVGVIFLAGCSGKEMKVTIQTASMEPEFHIGDELAINTEFDPAALEVGDIVAFRFSMSDGSEAIFVHRITEITEKDGKRYFQLKGDNNEIADFEEDNLLPEDRIVGVFDHVIYSKK